MIEARQPGEHQDYYVYDGDTPLCKVSTVLAALVMHCWSGKGEQKPLDLFVVKRTSIDRSTTSKPGMRWEIARKR